MKIIKITYIKTLVPNMSCGTGYSEPDKFHVICDTGFETDIWIDIWYRSTDDWKKEFYNRIYRIFSDDSVSNFEEAFIMYIDALIESKRYGITDKDKHEIISLNY